MHDIHESTILEWCGMIPWAVTAGLALGLALGWRRAARRRLTQWASQPLWLALSLTATAAIAITLVRLGWLPRLTTCRGTVELRSPGMDPKAQRPYVMFETAKGFAEVPPGRAVFASVGLLHTAYTEEAGRVQWDRFGQEWGGRVRGPALRRANGPADGVRVTGAMPVVQVIRQMYIAGGVDSTSPAAGVETADVASVVQAILNLDATPPATRRAALIAAGFRDDGRPVPGGTLVPVGALDWYYHYPPSYVFAAIGVWMAVWGRGVIVIRRRSRIVRNSAMSQRA
ncbi:MAG: hypothetical protein ACAI43_23535 [Phycisphaerae bacterium]|nr:hypothetical protein [Tepidisphaeraceae bacterium]